MSSTLPEPVLTEPVTRVSRSWTVRFGLLWFGYWMAYLAPVQLVLPNQFDALDHAHKVRDFGLVSGLTGIAAIITLPLFGALCDRTRTRFGRRRVWMAGGTAIFAAGLLLTGVQHSWWTVGFAWLLATLGLNAATAGATAAIADEVPDEQRGMISSAVYGPQAIGILVGVAALTALNIGGGPPANGGVAGGGGVLGYGVLAIVLLVTAAPFVARYRDVTATVGAPTDASAPSSPLRAPGPAVGAAPLPLSVRSLADSMWIDPRANPDFAWAFGGRQLVNLGNAFGTTYLLYFLQDDLKLADPNTGLLILTLVYLVFTLAATVLGGVRSDRSGRRRPYVAIAAVLQAIASFLLAFFPSFGVALVAAAFLGAGYGAYMSVDQALVTAVLPDALSRAKDLGIMNVGSVGPQALAPLGASLIIGSLGGYPVLFGTAGVTTVLGALMVYRIRSVR